MVRSEGSIERFADVDVTKIKRIGVIPYFYLNGELWMMFAVSTSITLTTIGGQYECRDFNSLATLYRERDEECPNFPLDPIDVIGRNDCIVKDYSVFVFQEIDPALVNYNQYNQDEIVDLVWLSQSQLREKKEKRLEIWYWYFGRLLREIYHILKNIRPTLSQPSNPFNSSLKQDCPTIPKTLGNYRDLLTDLRLFPWYNIFLVTVGRYAYITGGDRKYRLYLDQVPAAQSTILKVYPSIKIYQQMLTPGSTVSPEELLDQMFQQAEEQFQQQQSGKAKRQGATQDFKFIERTNSANREFLLYTLIERTGTSDTTRESTRSNNTE